MAAGKNHDALTLPLEVLRERTVEVLSRHFAHDNLTLDELEHRLELAYRARENADLHALTRDLPNDPVEAAERRAAPLPEAFTPESDRIVSIMTTTKRRGVWRPARQLELWAVMSDARLDLTEAVLGSGVTEIRLSALMATVRVIVPPGVRVVVQTRTTMTFVSDESLEPPKVGSGAPVVRLTGFAFMSELKVRVRRREQSSDELPDPG